MERWGITIPGPVARENSMKYCKFILYLVWALLVAADVRAVTIDMVTVGNPGNAGEVQLEGTFGGVGYNYRIGKHEVTNAQYTEFLNGVDPTGVNTLALYNTNMSSNVNGGINFTGGAGNGTKYEIKSGRDDNPVVFVSWYDSIRFANWLHNGQGGGDTENGAYTLGALGADGVPTDGSSITRNAGAQWWLPSENEWYKAAYHKNDGVTGNYWDYPTSTDAEPFSDQPLGSDAPTQSNTANFRKDDIIANGYDDGFAVTGSNSPNFSSQNYLTDVGAYVLSASSYGTFDQGGNVFERNEALITASARGLRGGSWNSSSSLNLLASNRFAGSPAGEYIGFRVASVVPEPSTMLLLCFGSLAVFWRRRGLLCASILAAAVGISFADRAAADTFGSGANAFDIEFVNIGNPGNAADDVSANPDFAGSVPYTYNIGKFEISEQMIDKANALGGLAITKDTRGADKPATSTSWNEAARFLNWLNTSTGSPPVYKFALQPGEIGYSSNANIELWTISDAGYNPNNLYRNSLARYFLPSVDEWYKAAYYDPTSSVYYDYPTRSNSAPTAVASGTAADTAVYNQATATGPADITLAGGLSPYGTMGQGGNVFEWEETDFDLVNGPTLSSSDRGVRGGSWVSSSSSLSSSFRNIDNPSGVGLLRVGFRVASSAVPEPSTLLLLCIGSLAVLWRSNRSR